MHASRLVVVSRAGNRRCIVAAILVLLAATGCAPSAVADQPVLEGETGASANEALAAPNIDWQRPYGAQAPTFEQFGDAQEAVEFAPLLPAFAEPDLIQTTPLDTVSGGQALVMVFTLIPEGTILVEEMPAGDMTVKDLESIADAHSGEAADSATGSTSEAFVPAYSIVALRGTEGLLVQGRGLGRVVWLEGDVRIDLMGESASPEQLLVLAEKF